MAAEKLRKYFNAIIGEGKRFSTQTEMARYLGLGQTTATKLYGFLDGADTRFSAVVDWLEKLGGQIVLPDEELEQFEMIPKVRAVAGAGESLVTSGKVTGQYAFRESFLKREHIHPEKCVLMCVAGDSMEPLIREGDTILVDESEKGKELRDGHIFVVGLSDALMVKRLAKIPNGWRLCSENKERPDIDVQGEDFNTFRVYGRVRWFGRVV